MKRLHPLRAAPLGLSLSSNPEPRALPWADIGLVLRDVRPVARIASKLGFPKISSGHEPVVLSPKTPLEKSTR